MRLGKKSQTRKRNEEVFCPKCKGRGRRMYSVKKEDVVRFQCNICDYKWTQNTITSFTERDNKFKGESDCSCGGKFEFDHIDGKTHYDIWKCNKCGAENTPETM